MAKAPADLRSLARSHTDTAVRTLASIMNNKDAPPAARVTAAEALLSRGWGKPVQPVEQGAPGEFERMSADEVRAELKREIAELGLAMPEHVTH